MPRKSICGLAAASLVFACKNQPAPASMAATAVVPVAAASAAEPDAADVIRGKVTEKIDVDPYSYLKIHAADGEVWTAVPKTSKGVGEVVSVVGPMWMENFKSATLNRTWSKIAFGTLQGEAAAPSPSKAAPARQPASAETGPLKVSKAKGPQGRTIADIYAQRAQLKDRPISVHGKVVKAINGVMGKNWLHLRDGTGRGATADLAVATDQTAGVGDTVLVSGTVHLNRDLGAGYHYDVIVEDAQVKGD